MSFEEPPTVAVIGCGPGGMFFCHALETRRRALLDAGDDEGLARLPTVTCFERATAPGGVWRAKRSFGGATVTQPATNGTGSLIEETESAVNGAKSGLDEDTVVTTNMYEALWTNGPKENIEFFDYTFDDHFKCPLPVYMPREDLLDYMTSRVTRHCPDFFEKYVQFGTSVQMVKYNHEKEKFEVKTHNWTTDTIATKEYDKCVWAAGENGKPLMPRSLTDMFREGGFQGRIIHSSDTANFEADVRGKRILLIGGGYSAEDLALMAIKVGAERVHISSRTEDNVISWTSNWPLNKVEILDEVIPVKVMDDGKTIHFSKTWWTFPDKWKTSKRVKATISDIDTIIFCTGYVANLDMLDGELRAPFKDPADNKVEVPADWRMKPNAVSDVLGDVTPGDVRWYESLVPYPDIYRGVLISNPSMMFIDNEMQPNPLFATDISAWLLLSFVVGSATLPSTEEMRKQNLEEVLRHMNNASLRYYMDSNYCDAWDENVDESEASVEALWAEAESDQYRSETRMMAKTMEMCGYPVSFGTYDDLNVLAEKTLDYGTLSFGHRTETVPSREDEMHWKTFRDCTDADKFRSFFTGTRAVPLHSKWLDIDPHDRTSLGYSIPSVFRASDESTNPKQAGQ